ncbi:hypothetical protein E4P38_00620 [Blastococcus sp. CT_GayMR16]|nr:hypothetical protein E4P38_00620 [Blastococcus sp. CT_GayMR16]
MNVANDPSGYCVLEGVLKPGHISPILAELAELAERDAAAGAWRSQRKLHVEHLLDAGPTFDRVWFSDRLLAVAAASLGRDFYLLGARYRAPLTDAGEQVLHVDDPGTPGAIPRLLNVIVPLVPFTALNGATRVVPGSHVSETPPTAPEDPLEPVPGERVLQVGAGSAIFFGGGLWHSGTRNRTGQPRHALAISYARRGSNLSTVPHAAEETLKRLPPGHVAMLHP